jgi:high-affinity iron transporter
VTSTLIALLAAGMASQAVLFLNQANVLVLLDTVVWDTSWILSDGSLLGKALHTLAGYNDRPTELQLIVYTATLAVTFVLMRVFAPVVKPAPAH